MQWVTSHSPKMDDGDNQMYRYLFMRIARC